MKKILLLAVIALSMSVSLSGQKLVIGERAPELKSGSWLIAPPSVYGKTTVVEFFHSANKISVERLTELDKLARENRGKLTVVVVTREDNKDVKKMLMSGFSPYGAPAFYPLLDAEGKIFSAYGVQYIPFSVVFDKRGRIVWLGNSSFVTNDDLLEIM